MWEEESVRTDSAYELDLGHIEFKRPGKHPRGNFDRHLDVWIREVGMEIIFRRYWLIKQNYFITLTILGVRNLGRAQQEQIISTLTMTGS